MGESNPAPENLLSVSHIAKQKARKMNSFSGPGLGTHSPQDFEARVVLTPVTQLNDTNFSSLD